MALSDYINSNFSQVKSQLGWDSDDLSAILAKTLEFYGVATEVLATDTTKLHKLADVAVWRQALNDVTLDYDFSADNASYKRSQQHDMIRENLEEAVTYALVYMPNYSITINASDDHPDWTE